MALTCWDSIPPADVVEGCVEVYRAAFGEAPYHETPDQAAGLRDRLERYASRDGFLVPVSYDDAAGQVAGFALAVTAHAGDWWRDRVAACLGPTRTARWLGDTCLEVVHVAVHPYQQRKGHGRALLQALQSSGDSGGAGGIGTGVLSCHPAAPAAQQLYLGEGWRVLTTEFRTSPDQPGYLLMARDLGHPTERRGAD